MTATKATRTLDRSQLPPTVLYAIVCASVHKGEDPGHDSTHCVAVCAESLPDYLTVDGWWEECPGGWQLWPVNPDEDQTFRPMAHLVPVTAVAVIEPRAVTE